LGHGVLGRIGLADATYAIIAFGETGETVAVASSFAPDKTSAEEWDRALTLRYLEQRKCNLSSGHASPKHGPRACSVLWLRCPLILMAAWLDQSDLELWFGQAESTSSKAWQLKIGRFRRSGTP
jgi:hypothetical protein